MFLSQHRAYYQSKMFTSCPKRGQRKLVHSNSIPKANCRKSCYCQHNSEEVLDPLERWIRRACKIRFHIFNTICKSREYSLSTLFQRISSMVNCSYNKFLRLTGINILLKTQVSQWYELVVFTASMEIYGAAVADKLDNNRGILRRRYYS